MNDNFKNKRYDYDIKNNLDFTNPDKSSRVDNKNFDTDDEQLLPYESSLTTISENFKYFLTDIVNPKITDTSKNTIPVNVKHENAEDIVDIQKLGYIRDNKTKKPITPIITFKRLSIEKETLFPTFLKNENRVVISTKADPKNKYLDYDNKPFYPVKEYYTVSVPDFLNIPFEVNIWTSYSYQLDNILERMYYYEGAFYGKNKFKSKITVTDSGINIIKDVDSQRIIRSNVSFQVMGKLVLSDLNTIKNVTKTYSIRNIKIDEHYE